MDKYDREITKRKAAFLFPRIQAHHKTQASAAKHTGKKFGVSAKTVLRWVDEVAASKGKLFTDPFSGQKEFVFLAPNTSRPSWSSIDAKKLFAFTQIDTWHKLEEFCFDAVTPYIELKDAKECFEDVNKKQKDMLKGWRKGLVPDVIVWRGGLSDETRKLVDILLTRDIIRTLLLYAAYGNGHGTLIDVFSLIAKDHPSVSDHTLFSWDREVAIKRRFTYDAKKRETRWESCVADMRDNTSRLDTVKLERLMREEAGSLLQDYLSVISNGLSPCVSVKHVYHEAKDRPRFEEFSSVSAVNRNREFNLLTVICEMACDDRIEVCRYCGNPIDAHRKAEYCCANCKNANNQRQKTLDIKMVQTNSAASQNLPVDTSRQQLIRDAYLELKGRVSQKRIEGWINTPDDNEFWSELSKYLKNLPEVEREKYSLTVAALK